jgi:hypothetical protein
MKALVGSIIVLIVLVRAGVSAETSEDPNITRAKFDIRALSKAALALAAKNDSIFPEKLDDLAPLLEVGEKALVDPWGNKYQYAAAGKKNGGKQPDIWTETPDKKIIGNWPEEKK